MAGSVTIQGLLPGTTSGTQYVGPFTLVPDVNGNFEASPLALVSGSNNFSVPTWATAIIIIPPTTNTHPLNLTGAATATAEISLSATQPSILSLLIGATSTLNLVTNASYTVTLVFF